MLQSRRFADGDCDGSTEKGYAFLFYRSISLFLLILLQELSTFGFTSWSRDAVTKLRGDEKREDTVLSSPPPSFIPSFLPPVFKIYVRRFTSRKPGGFASRLLLYFSFSSSSVLIFLFPFFLAIFFYSFLFKVILFSLCNRSFATDGLPSSHQFLSFILSYFVKAVKNLPARMSIKKDFNALANPLQFCVTSL